MPVETLELDQVKPLDLSDVKPLSETLDLSDVKPLDVSEVKPIAVPRKRDEGMGGGASRASVPKVQSFPQAAKNLGAAALEIAKQPAPVVPILQGAGILPEKPTSIAGGVATGAAEMAGELTSPLNVAIGQATGGLGLISKLGVFGRALPRAIGAGFSVEMLKNAYDKIPEVKKAIDQEDYATASKALTTQILEVGMGGLGLRHAAGYANAEMAAGIERHNAAAEQAVQTEAQAPTVVDEVPVVGLARPLTVRKSVKVMGYDADGKPRGPITADVVDEQGKTVFSGDEHAADQFLAKEKPAGEVAGAAPETPTVPSEPTPAATEPAQDTYDTPDGPVTVQRRYRTAKGVDMVIYQRDTPTGPRRQVVPLAKFQDLVAVQPQAAPEVLDVDQVQPPTQSEVRLPDAVPTPQADAAPTGAETPRISAQEAIQRIEENNRQIQESLKGIQEIREGQKRGENVDYQIQPIKGALEETSSTPTAVLPTKAIEPASSPEETEEPEKSTPSTEISTPEPVPQTAQKNVDRMESMKPDVAATMDVGSTRVLNLKDGTKFKEKLEDIPVKDIQANPENKMYREKVQEYVEKPSPVPIEVRATPDGGYIVHDGHHRLAAAIESGAKRVRAWVPVKEPVAQDAELAARTVPELRKEEKSIQKDVETHADVERLDAVRQEIAERGIEQVSPPTEPIEKIEQFKKGDVVQWTAQGKTYRGEVQAARSTAGNAVLDVRPEGKRAITTIAQRMAVAPKAVEVPKEVSAARESLAQSGFDKPYSELTPGQQESVNLRAERRLAPLPVPEKKPVTPQVVPGRETTPAKKAQELKDQFAGAVQTDHLSDEDVDKIAEVFKNAETPRQSEVRQKSPTQVKPKGVESERDGGIKDAAVQKPAGAEDQPALASELPEGSESAGERGAVGPRSRGSVRKSRPDRGTSGIEEPGLEPSAGVVGPGVGNAAAAERSFPPRPVDTNTGNHDRDYRIPDDRHLIGGSPERRARTNIEALKIVRVLEEEKRIATLAEQQVLGQYVGWGAVPQIFAGDTPEWKALQEELTGILSEEEFNHARRSTTNAHYTSDEIVDSMWKAMEHLGAKAGMSWLEPAVGSGSFFGRQPEGLLPGARRVGVDKDSVVGKVARALYPDSSIEIAGLEEAQLPENYFDGIISNVPFGDFGVYDPQFRNQKFLMDPIHNYFFAKSVQLVRPGGVIAFITSRYTMDGYAGPHKAFKGWIDKNADFLGAVRLPTNAFMQNAGTHVLTDLIFLRKRLPDAEPASQKWAATGTVRLRDMHGQQQEIPISEYYIAHPENILGEQQLQRGQFSYKDYAVKGQLTKEQLNAALARALPKDGFQEFKRVAPTRRVSLTELGMGATAKSGGLFFDDKGALYRKNTKGSAELIDVPDTVKARVRGQLQVRDVLTKLMAAELRDAPEGELKALRGNLNGVYDSYVKKNGLLSTRANIQAMAGDPDAPILVGLERNYDPEKKTADKAPIFSKSVLSAPRKVTEAGSAKDALYISLNETAGLDWDRMSELTGKNRAELQGELKGLVFEDPQTGIWETAEEYLSGSVRTKLREVEALAKMEPRFKENVEALRNAIPEDVPPGKIGATMGVTWVPLDVYQDFAKGVTGSANPTIRYAGGRWFVEAPGSTRTSWATSKVSGASIFEETLNMQRIKIKYKDSEGREHTDTKETIAAQNKQRELQKEFQDYLFVKDSDRATRMHRLYNDLQNDLRLRTFDGSHLTFPGMSRAVLRNGDLDPHQKAAAWRQIVQKNVLLAHGVGLGKTFEMIVGGMELKRLGLINRPMYVVPNATLTSWQDQFNALYPQARVIVFSEKDLEKDNRRAAIGRIATGDWDAVVLPHSSFGKIPVGDELFEEHYAKREQELQYEIDEAQSAGLDSRRIKRMEKAKERLMTSLRNRRNEERQDLTVTWEQLGIDQMFVDESHEFKKLGFGTKMQGVAGIDTGGNQRTLDLIMKMRHTQRAGRGVVFATGTPVTNTMGELYNIMRYLIEPEMEARGLGKFDEWAANFGRTVDVWEPKVEGGGYRVKARFAQFMNIPELATLFRTFADVATAEGLSIPLPRPEIATGGRQAVESQITDWQKAFQDSLVKRAVAIRANPRAALPDNMLSLYGDALKMALDIRMVVPDAPDNPRGRLNQAADKIHDIWKQSAKNKGAQAVFLDFGKPASEGNTGFSPYDDLIQKLVDRGIPKEQIAHIYEAKNKPQRARLFKKVNDGEIRVLLGSTQKMGVGVNIQNRLVALHHLDVPHRPSDLEQREGRAIRQGNMNPEVSLFYYLTKGTLDENRFSSVLRKAKFINQVMQGDTTVRESEDIGDMVPSLEQFQAMASGDPRVMRKLEVDAEVDRLGSLQSSWRDQQFRDRGRLERGIPSEELMYKKANAELGMMIKRREKAGRVWTLGKEKLEGEGISAKVAEKIWAKAAEAKEEKQTLPIGTAWGLPIATDGGEIYFSPGRSIHLGDYKGVGITAAVENYIKGLEGRVAQNQESLDKLTKERDVIQQNLSSPWPYEADYAKLQEEAAKLFEDLGGNAVDETTAAADEGEIESALVEASEGTPDAEEPTTPETEVQRSVRQSIEKTREAVSSPPSSGPPPIVKSGDRIELARSLQNPSQMRTKQVRAVWGGNKAAEGHLVTDGHVLIDANFITNEKMAASLKAKSDQGTYPAKSIQESLDRALTGAEKLLEELGYGRVPGSRNEEPLDVVYYVDQEGKVYAADADYIQLVNRAIGKFSVYGSNPENALVFKKGTQPAALVMPFKLADTQKPDVAEARTRLSVKPSEGERGSAPLDFMSGGLLSLTQKLAGRTPEDPHRHRSIPAHMKRLLLPGEALAEVEEANPNLFMDWVRAASHEAISSNMVRSTVSAIKKTLAGTGHTFDEMRAAYTQSRLNGIRDRWIEFSEMFEQVDNDKLVEAFDQKDTEGRSFWLQTLSAIEGKHGLPQDLGQTAAALLEREDFDTLRQLMEQTFTEAAANVQDILPQEQYESLVDFLTGDEVGRAAHTIYKDNIEAPLSQAHARNEGIFTEALGELDTYIPLTPFEEKPQAAAFSKRAPMRKPKNPHSYFATGLSSTGYTTAMETFSKRISKAVKDNNRAAAIQAMMDTRWARPMPEDWDGTFRGPDGREYTGTREVASDARTMFKDGRVIHLPARQVIMPRFMAESLRPILDREFMADNEISQFAHKLNSLSVQWTPAELIYHGTGLIGTLNANTPFLGNTGLDKFLSAPVLKFLTVLHRVATVDPSSPESLAKLREMADVGALPAKVGKVTFDKEYAEEHGIQRERTFAPFLYGPRGLDVRTRLVMHDIYKAAFPDGTSRDFYHFINQLGNYTPELQGPIERWFKSMGIDPFATAGMTRQVNAYHAWTGTGPMPNWQARLWQVATGGAVAAVAVWVLSYKYLTGQWPTQDKRAKLLMLPVGGGGHGKLDKYRHSKLGNLMWGDGPETGYLSFAFFFPIPARGARLFGLQGAFETKQLGGSPAQILDAAQKDVVNTVVLSRVGPVASAALVGLFGTHPYLTHLHDRARPSPQLLPAIPFERKAGFLGGLAPSLVGGRPSKHPGLASEAGARSAAALGELNGFYGDQLRHLGVLGEDAAERGNPWVRTFIGLTAPNLVQNATNPYARANALAKER